MGIVWLLFYWEILLPEEYLLFNVNERKFEVSAITEIIISALPKPSNFAELTYLLRFNYLYCYCLVIV